jgi:hypothetical protein
MEVSKKDDILISWILWQFYEMPKFLFGVWNNYFIFATNLFSVPLLLKTFFAPWRKYAWSYPKNFDIKEFFNTLVGNIISRILGAIMRTALIFVGILFQIFVAIAGSVILLAWLLFPFLIVCGFLFILIY